MTMSHCSSCGEVVASAISLMRSFMLEQNIAYRAPKVAPVGGEGTLVVRFDISLFRSLDILQGFGCLFIVIEWREQAWLYAHMQLLHLRRIEAEILPTQRSHSYKFHLSLEDVDAHGQFVNPGTPEPSAPKIHPVVVRELPTLLQSLVLQDIRLQILMWLKPNHNAHWHMSLKKKRQECCRMIW